MELTERTKMGGVAVTLAAVSVAVYMMLQPVSAACLAQACTSDSECGATLCNCKIPDGQTNGACYLN